MNAHVPLGDETRIYWQNEEIKTAMTAPGDTPAPDAINNMTRRPLDVIGWREWIGLPDVGVRRIKAKIDTGAKSSAIHAYNIHVFTRDGTEFAAFDLHPRQREESVIVSAEAEVLEYRRVRNSGGTVTTRPVIVTHAILFGRRFPIELTLANRDAMGYRMLLGREALQGRFLVDVDQSYLGSLRKRRRRREAEALQELRPSPDATGA